MYDKDLTNKWHVEIEFFEDDVHTHASAHARLRDDTLTTTGDAYRNPKDPSVGLTPDGGHLTGGTAGPAGRMSVWRASVRSTPRSFGSRLPAW
jgi:hypothetical protein